MQKYSQDYLERLHNVATSSQLLAATWHFLAAQFREQGQLREASRAQEEARRWAANGHAALEDIIYSEVT